MKKLILAAFALTTAVGVFAQGTVIFGNRYANGTSIGLSLHIWGPSSTAPGLSLIGLGSNDTSSNPLGLPSVALGAASGMVMIGQGIASGAQYGIATTFAQLIGANGSGAAESSLVPVGTTTTFKSGASLGSVTTINDTLSPAVPSAAAAATLEIVAWDNSSTLYATWAQASVAWLNGLIAAGHTSPFVTTAIGGGLNPIVDLNNDLGNYNGMTSFNLYFVPEPSSFALAGLGVAALLAIRRRK